MTKRQAHDLLTVEHLSKHFPVASGFIRKAQGTVRAVDDVSFSIREGETLGMVGESGCGKSTIGKTILRAFEPTSGVIRYHFGDEEMDVSTATMKTLRSNGFRSRTQMIFQDPNSSLDPRMTVMDIIAEPIRTNIKMPEEQLKDRVLQLMEHVGLDKRYLKRYPHAFSGGQRQRISIARALSTNPRFVVADEPTSALDASIQAQILNLMQDLQRDFGLTYLFISHNLGVVRHIADRVAVMYLGKLVELAPNADIFENPRHPYTEALMKSVPIADPSIPSGLESAPGEIGNPLNPPTGCRFHPRCAFAVARCSEEVPEFRDVGNEHFTACHLADDLRLDGIKKRNETIRQGHVNQQIEQHILSGCENKEEVK
jgi:peptide/nickel transport system ATP-binding protein